MAGLVDGLDPAEFRSGIRFAMNLGLPPIEADRPVFVTPQEATNDANADEEDIPFDPSARPQVPPPLTKSVPCAVEYVDAAGRVETFGIVNPSKIRITLLDEEYQQIRGFSYVVIGGDRYNYAKTEPPLGLGSVGVWIIHAIAEDES